jgi:multiple sugar transport system permease protein
VRVAAPAARRVTAGARRDAVALPAAVRRQLAWKLCLVPALLVLGAVTVAPAVFLLVTSLTPLDLTRPDTARDFSQPLVNYRLLLDDERFWNSVWVQVKLSAATVALQLAGGFALALLLNVRSGFLEACRTVFLIPMVLPPIVVAILWKVLYTPDISPVHWALAAAGVPIPALITDPSLALPAIVIADVWEWLPFTMLMVLAALQMMPGEPVEAARIDGASAWQVTRHVVLPYLRPALLVAGLFRLIDSIKAFPLIFVLTDGGPGTVTEVTNYYAFRQAFNFSYLGFSSAITVVMVAAVFVLSWWLVRVIGAGADSD